MGADDTRPVCRLHCAPEWIALGLSRRRSPAGSTGLCVAVTINCPVTQRYRPAVRRVEHADPCMSGLLASADGFIDPDRSWRRHRCRHRAARTAACRLVGRRGTGHLARPRLAGIAAADRRPGHPDDRTPQRQPFVVRAAAGGLVDLVAVPPLRQWTRGQRTHALVLGDPAGLDHPSTAGRVHRLRHPAVVAVAAASYDVVERVHHRPGVHAVAVAGLRGGLVCARARLRSTRW